MLFFYFMDFIILTLACWRISSLFVDEQGPFEMFDRLRYALGVRHNEFNVAYSKNVIGGALSCLWCFSASVGIILMIAYSFYPAQTVLACLPLALSAGAIVVSKWMQ